MKRFGASLSDKQISLARAIERAGITTYSQVIKAMERRNNEQIEAWKKSLQVKQEGK